MNNTFAENAIEGIATRAAIVGFGSVAVNAHLAWFSSEPNVDLVGIVEPTRRGAEVAEAACPGLPVFGSLSELLRAEELTFIDITSPPDTHADLLAEALAAGVNTFCEKPFVRNRAELRGVELFRKPDSSVIGSCHNWYFAPAIRRALDLADEGAIGTTTSVDFQALRPSAARGSSHWKPDWRECDAASGGIISDLGYHGIYLVSRFLNSFPVEVTTTATRQRNKPEHISSIILGYPRDKVARLSLSWTHPVRTTWIRISGTDGELTIDNNSVSCFQNKRAIWTEQFASLTNDSWHADWTRASLQDFLSVLLARDGRVHDRWAEVRNCVLTLDAARISSVHGRTVPTRLHDPI